MSPELQALLEQHRAAAEAERDRIAAMLDAHHMAYRSRRSALLATSNMTRARQL